MYFLKVYDPSSSTDFIPVSGIKTTLSKLDVLKWYEELKKKDQSWIHVAGRDSDGDSPILFVIRPDEISCDPSIHGQKVGPHMC